MCAASLGQMVRFLLSSLKRLVKVKNQNVWHLLMFVGLAGSEQIGQWHRWHCAVHGSFAGLSPEKNEPGNCQCTVAIYFVQNLVIQFLLFCLIPLLKTKSATHKLSLHTVYLKVSLSAELVYWLNILFNVIDTWIVKYLIWWLIAYTVLLNIWNKL